MSILCAAIKWLKDHNQFEKQNLLDEIAKCELDKKENMNANDWLLSQSKDIEVSKTLKDLMFRLSRIDEHEKKLLNMKDYAKIATENEFNFNNNKLVEDSENSDSDDENILLEDINSMKDGCSIEEDSVQIYEPLKVEIFLH